MQATYTKTLSIPKIEAQLYERMMQAKTVDYKKNCIPRYECIKSWTFSFGTPADSSDIYEVDLKVCSSDSGKPLWCEAVLFRNGSEVCCSDVSDELFGTWKLETIGNNPDDKLVFIIEVIADINQK